MPGERTFRLYRADVVDFGAAWQFQRETAAQILQGAAPALLLLQHFPVYTLGRHADPSHLLDAAGVPVVRTDRGGEVTWHGPGQLVAYPLLRLRDAGMGVKTYVGALERAGSETLATFGVRAAAKKRCVGLWTARGKIASIGVRVARGVTMHGLAMNVNNDLAPFGRMNPCGVPGDAVTSLSVELGRQAEVAEAASAFVPCFARAFRFSGWTEQPPVGLSE